MENNQKLKEDLKILEITDIERLTIRFVKMKYRRLTKQRHPDRIGGKKEDFQDLQDAYKRIINYLEENMENEEESDEDYEKEFFMKNNIMREYSNSFVIYIQNEMAVKWREILKRHLATHKTDKCRIIFKTGQITITLYEKPKKDPRAKIHIQSGDQGRNLEFIMDKLSLFYREVCLFTPVETAALNMQKAICGNCGKQFKDRKGVKQHMLRIHVQKVKRVETEREVNKSIITLEESSHASSDTISQERIVTMPVTNVIQELHETLSTSTPSLTAHEENKETPTQESKRDDENFIRGLIGSLVSHCGEDAVSEPDNNYQCGECGETFKDSTNIEKHMDMSHAREGCIVCRTHKREEEKYKIKIEEKCEEIEALKKLIEEKSEAMEILKEQNNNLTKKNVSMIKEIKTSELALAECLFEKAELKKEVHAKNETIDETTKLNTVLEEEIKVKDDIIKALSENDVEIIEDENTNKDGKLEPTAATMDGSEKETRFKCNDCDYTTYIKKHLMGHIIAHTGQYQCQSQGCKLKFQTYNKMDEHTKNDHAPKDFMCPKCDIPFKAQYESQLHNQKKHTRSMTVECEKCGNAFEGVNDLEMHKNNCEHNFTRVPKKGCRYFANGRCNRGEMCKFSHQEQMNNKLNIPECRNGLSCRYLERGMCMFYHRGAGVQKMNKKNNHTFNKSNKNFSTPECRNGVQCWQLALGKCVFSHSGAREHNRNENRNYKFNKGYCYYMEDCSRVPNCPYVHYEQDFPQLPKTGKPPTNPRVGASWQKN